MHDNYDQYCPNLDPRLEAYKYLKGDLPSRPAGGMDQIGSRLDPGSNMTVMYIGIILR